MEHLRKIRFWRPRAPVASSTTDALKPDCPALVCHDETIDYAAYHLCVLDPILGNLLCVGDNAPVVVLTRGRRRVALPVQKGARWLDAHIFAGTSSFLLLSPECLLLFDFTRRHSPSALFPRGRNESLFACLHIPQGMTWGVVGCRGGSVMYWKLKEEADSLSLVWAALTTDLLALCRPFLPTQTPPSSSSLLCGHVHSIDSNPTSSNSLVAVLSGVPGVCKWHLDENSLSGFYRLPHVTAGTSLQACRVTPGGTYIIATKSDLATVFIWSNGGKKAKDRSVEVFWTLETGCRLPYSPGNGDTEGVDEDDSENVPCGIHIARSAGSSSQAQSDKKCHIHLLLYSVGELVELVLDVEGRQLHQREDILAHVAALHLERMPARGTKGALAVKRVIPCVRSSYWVGMWTERDLDVLLMTSSASGPLLIRRCRSKRNLESVDTLQELPRGANASVRMLLLSPSLERLNAFWCSVRNAQQDSDPWRDVLQGGVGLAKPSDLQKWDGPPLAFGTLPDVPCGGVCLFPLSNECVPVPTSVMEQYTAWGSHVSVKGCNTFTLLEQIIPELPHYTEMILRVVACADAVVVSVVHLSSTLVEPLVKLSRECLMPDSTSAEGKGGDDDNDAGTLARTAVLVSCRIARSGGASSGLQLLRGGCSVLLQLQDASFVLVDLSGAQTGEEGLPFMVRFPAALFPAGSTLASFDTVWLDCPGPSACVKVEATNRMCLALVCVLSDQKGVIVWDMSCMRLLSYFPSAGGEGWRYNAVIACSRTNDFPVLGADLLCEVVLKPTAGAAKAAPHGSEGVIYLLDVFGRLLLPVRIRYAPEKADAWAVKKDDDEAEWYSIPSGKSATLRFCAQVVGGHVVLAGEVNHSVGETLMPSARIAMVEEGPSWMFGPLEWHLREGPERNEEEVAATVPAPRSSRRSQRGEASVILCAEGKVDVLAAARLAANGAAKPLEPLCSFEPGCAVEHVVACEFAGALLVLTRDANRWRRVRMLDLETAQPLAESKAMVHFTQEERLRIYPLPVEGGNLHVYVVGRGGALGHLVFAAADGEGGAMGPSAGAFFAGLPCSAAPSSFQAYQRFLPPPPTTKQEGGFLKRLLALPWEEEALKVEGLLRAERQESFEELRRRLAPAAGPGEAPQLKAAHGRQQGSRYAEIKSTAERENVTLNEARRLMGENQAKLRERGERVAEIANRSRELAEEAARFQDLARMLREKQRNKWM
ncbi:putative R-SNARE protein [Trypanosoma rangeli]|uniref:Putative R-SNARE protein n=1 Tax=Trypanosoma rangeli TaxID=5698 RepID=A0A3R7RFP0_TRYRA|nr:putative R-SNARE protein [Trypanosoma rangeli]RNF01776.1 putative R-SNARE protein [Trypanosoma rangeli]|eukprot:RNF01776.1 putative R-SNARE protein [Trypanosoma rangeli]